MDDNSLSLNFVYVKCRMCGINATPITDLSATVHSDDTSAEPSSSNASSLTSHSQQHFAAWNSKLLITTNVNKTDSEVVLKLLKRFASGERIVLLLKSSVSFVINRLTVADVRRAGRSPSPSVIERLKLDSAVCLLEPSS